MVVDERASDGLSFEVLKRNPWVCPLGGPIGKDKRAYRVECIRSEAFKVPPETEGAIEIEDDTADCSWVYHISHAEPCSSAVAPFCDP